MVSCSVFLPPHGMGPQVAPPSLLFASYWQHFWGPASYLLGLCSISDHHSNHTDHTYCHIKHTIPNRLTYHTYHPYNTNHSGHTYHTSHTYQTHHTFQTCHTRPTIHTIHTVISNIPYPTYLHTTPTIHTIPTIHAIHTKHTIHSKHTIHTIPTIHAKHAPCHIYIVIHTLHPPAPQTQHHTHPAHHRGEGDSTMADPWPWPGGVERWTIYIYYIYIYIL